MSKCSDCVHFSLCSAWSCLDNTNNIFEPFSCFEDKAHYIELPCKIGDTVYAIKMLTDGKFTQVVSDGLPVNRISVDKHGMFLTVDYGHTLSCDNFGKTVFLTREKAEQALKEKHNA